MKAIFNNVSQVYWHWIWKKETR